MGEVSVFAKMRRVGSDRSYMVGSVFHVVHSGG